MASQDKPKNGVPDQDANFDTAKTPQRNPHPDFKKLESSRPDWSTDKPFTYTKTKTPEWTFGDGANDGGESLTKAHREIDPYEEGRPVIWNYKLLISGIVPRPVAFVSTISKDGTSTNLSPFSFFQVINHDPPMFIISYAGSGGTAKDSLINVKETGELTINIISEHFIEAANATAVNSPYGVSEWALTGLTPAPSRLVKPSRVKEAIFSIEAKLVETRAFESKVIPGKKTNVLTIVEGIRFWAREDAINKEGNLLDPAILAPVARLGGISYSRTQEAYELERLDWDKEKAKGNVKEELVKPKAEGQ